MGLKPELRIHRSVLEFEKLVSDKSFPENVTKILSTSYLAVREPRQKTIVRVQAGILKAIREYLDDNGFMELLPPIIGPVTDPGIRGAKQVTIDYYGREYKVMSSAILYKQMMVTVHGKIYFVSPNVRLEPPETIYTGRHLTEFFQVDIEWARASYHDVMSLAEGLFLYVVKRIKEDYRRELEELGRELDDYKKPFKRYTHKEAVDLLRSLGYNASYAAEIPWEGEKILSGIHKEPFFIYDYPKGSRGFYDMEDAERVGILRDFDMLYPEGFGEAISGAEREYIVDKVLARMKESGENPAKYEWYLEMLKEGIEPSAGFGIGVERFTRFICGLGAIWEARPYPKVAGVYSP
ncbi:MAG: asparagine synthetase A [Thermoprotei archaeon]